MYRRALLFIWGIVFVLAEAMGSVVFHLLSSSGIGNGYSVAVADVVIITIRFSLLAYIASMVGVSLANAIYNPLPCRKSLVSLLLLTMSTAVFDYLVAVLIQGSYKPQLVDYSYYVEKNLLWAFPLRVAYYLSEITVMNYMYIIAGKAWSFSKPPITSGTLFLILTWALPHIFTKNIAVMLYAIIIVLIFYMGYEYTKTPITPVILWFTILTV